MSNLKLPLMSRESLAAQLGCSDSRKIAYATEASKAGVRGTDVRVHHHGNLIAEMGLDRDREVLKIYTAGWDSMTTSQRLDRIVIDAGLPFRVGIRQGETWLLNSSLDKLRRLESATFVDMALVEVNGRLDRIGGEA